MLALGGCTNWSGDVATYRRVLDGPTPATRPAALAAGEPLSLARALALADADNESIASSGEDYVQALAEKMRAAGTFLPTLTLSPTFNVSNGGAGGFVIGGTTTTTGGTTGGTGTGGSGGPAQVGGGGSGTSHQLSVPLSASVNGSLANVSNLKAAGLTAEQRADLLLSQREAILLQVSQSYYNVLKAERQVGVYEASLKSKAERVRDQEARFKLGNVRPLDVAQTQADQAGVRASLTQAKTDAANARSALARLIGAPAVSGPLGDGFDPPADAGTADDWHRTAESDRQDLRAAAKAVASAQASLEAAVRQYFPSVTLNLSYFLYNAPSSVQTWTGAVSANIPIFSALSIEADVRKAWSVYRQAGLAESQARRVVVDDVNQAFQNLRGSRSRVADLTVQVEAARRAVDLAERSYAIGSISNLDRLTQQDNLLTAELNLVAEQFGAKSSYLSLVRAAGGLGAHARG